MSWSINYVGTPEGILAALEADAARQSGQCKVEFDAALPGLKTLVSENFAPKQVILRLKASGHGVAKEIQSPDGKKIEQVNRCCSVSLETIGELLT